MLDGEERALPDRKSLGPISGYPSPQRLKSYYDSLSNHEELRGDLFSLGMLALQLIYLNENVTDLYVNPNPTFRNYTI